MGLCSALCWLLLMYVRLIYSCNCCKALKKYEGDFHEKLGKSQGMQEQEQWKWC